MAITNKKFKFVSPGVIVNEIDNSQLPAATQPDGPVIIGRTERGPGMVPVEITSFSDFVEVFGNPVAGNASGDVWRDGNNTAPTYASYAAEAWLKNSNKVTMIRLLGDQHSEAVTSGKAGWEMPFAASGGGAYGLFVFQSGTAATNVTGTLAAVFYCGATTAFELSGALRHVGTITTGTAALIGNTSGYTGFEFTGQIVDGSTVSDKTSFNFDRTSDRFIRKVFNTNPIMTNGDVVTSTKKYWLGETYEENLVSLFGSSPSTPFYATVMALSSGDVDGGNFRMGSQKASTGWVFSQDLSSNTASYDPDNMQKLFRFEDLDSGESNQRKFKVSLQDIKPSQNPSVQPYGSFTVVVREVGDTDSAPRILESFVGCDLNPSSPNYVALKIGDKFREWSDAEARYITKGSFDNNSKFIRVVMNSDVDTGVADPACLPFGYYGPKRYKSFTTISGSTSFFQYGSTTTTQSSAMAKTANVKDTNASGALLNVGTVAFTGSVLFPSLALRGSSASGSLSTGKNAYFGALFNRQTDYVTVDKSHVDLTRALPVGLSHFSDSPLLEDSFVFSLDDLSGSTQNPSTSTVVAWAEGNRVAGTSLTAQSGASALLNAGWNRFTLPLFGGFDGFDITESEPFRNTGLSGGTDTTNYAYYSLGKAISIAADPMINMNVAVIPGVTDSGIKSRLIQLCEERGDSIAILDPVGGFVPRAESTAVSFGTITNVDTVVSNTRNQAYNTSYAAMYYPWVKSVDSRTGQQVWLPPSVPALGVFSSTDRNADPWFAPAGFTRGGLSAGAGGVSVVGVAQQLTAKERDKLYEININPIAQFPAEGIVVYGQKTLQFSRSALDRINVRRLLLYAKKEISRIAATTLFNPNTVVTWNDFKSRATILLDSIKSRYGLEEFKVILDETTTTPDLVDQNIMYAKILLKPTKTAEFIAVDFVLTNSGASFED